MEEQLVLLHEIKSALWILIYLIGIGIFFSAVRAIIISYKTIKNEIEEAFNNTVSVMYDNGDYDQVIEYCLDHLEKKPKDAYGYWFLGKAYYRKEDYKEALNNFNKTIEISPYWDKEWVEPYREKINAKINTTNN